VSTDVEKLGLIGRRGERTDFRPTISSARTPERKWPVRINERRCTKKKKKKKKKKMAKERDGGREGGMRVVE